MKTENHILIGKLTRLASVDQSKNEKTVENPDNQNANTRVKAIKD